jgi:hypothetical protein
MTIPAQQRKNEKLLYAKITIQAVTTSAMYQSAPNRSVRTQTGYIKTKVRSSPAPSFDFQFIPNPPAAEK